MTQSPPPIPLLGGRPPPPPTYAAYLRLVHASLEHPHRPWRDGQTFFNVLHAGRPDLADAVRGTDLDPFHRDDRIEAFLAWVADHWDDSRDAP